MTKLKSASENPRRMRKTRPNAATIKNPIKNKKKSDFEWR